MRTITRPGLFALIACLALAAAGCASVGGGGGGDDRPFSDLRAFVREDVGQALMLAKAASDPGAPYRTRCYTTLLAAISASRPAGPALDAKGLISGFEVAVELAAKLRTKSEEGLLSEAIQADCGYLVDELKRFVLRSGAKFAPIPGAGTVGGILFR